MAFMIVRDASDSLLFHVLSVRLGIFPTSFDLVFDLVPLSVNVILCVCVYACVCVCAYVCVYVHASGVLLQRNSKIHVHGLILQDVQLGWAGVKCLPNGWNIQYFLSFYL